jgi:hypothetical protein
MPGRLFGSKKNCAVSEQSVRIEIPGEAARLRLRQTHNLRLVGAEFEGFSAAAIPTGVYGFSYAPATEAAPLFARYGHGAFEVHKIQPDTFHIVGFTDAAGAAAVSSGAEPQKLRLFAEPREQAAEAVRIAYDRIGRVRQHSEREGNGLEFMLLPVSVPSAAELAAQ